MVVDLNSTAILPSFWADGFPVLLDKISPLFGILKAVGVVFIVYLLFLIVRSIRAMRDHQRLKRVEEKLDLLLDKLHIQGKETKKFFKEEKKKKKKRFV